MKRKVALILPFVLGLVLLLPLVAFANVDWFDDFDSYAVDSNMCGQGGWTCWDLDPGAAAYVSDDEALSAPHSVEITGVADLVHTYTGYTSGQWAYTAWQYIPGDMVGLSYFIMLNTYAPLGTNNWSLQLEFDAAGGVVLDFDGGATLPLVTDQWVPIEVVIDLDIDLQEVYYNGTLLFADSWANHASGGGILEIAAVDLWSNGATSVYYDDMALFDPNVVNPSLEVDKSPDTQKIVQGGNADFTITVTNTGDITLTVLAVDPLVPDCDAIGDLGPMESDSWTCTDVGVASSYTNTVWVTGTLMNEPVIVISDTAYVEVNPPTAVSLSSFGAEDTGLAMIWLAITAAVVVGAGLFVVVRRRQTSKF
jgi:uncharacterized repeat protein (TIGR01451 family)